MYSYVLRITAQFPCVRFHSCHSWQHFNNSCFSIKKNPVEEFYCAKKHLPSFSFSIKLPFCCSVCCFSGDSWNSLKESLLNSINDFWSPHKLPYFVPIYQPWLTDVIYFSNTLTFTLCTLFEYHLVLMSSGRSPFTFLLCPPLSWTF